MVIAPLPQMPPKWIFDKGTRADARLGFDHDYQDGYDFMHFGSDFGWRPLASWGADGWDLGDWPYVVYMVKQEAERFWLISRCEGDLSLYEFPDRDTLFAKLDELAEWSWRHYGNGPSDLAEYPHGKLPENYRGPYRTRSEA